MNLWIQLIGHENAAWTLVSATYHMSIKGANIPGAFVHAQAIFSHMCLHQCLHIDGPALYILKAKSNFTLLLYIPFLGIGYIRLLLLLGSLLLYENPNVFLGLYIVSVILDAVDGIVARKWNQTSVFGAWFDVVIDLISRGSLWCFISRWGYFVMMIEWLTFIATHTRGPNWKIPDEEFPWICKKVMANGFKTATGSYAITGIFVLPLWIYGIQSGFLKNTIKMPITVQYLLCAFLVVGRLLALSTEGFFIWQHIKAMLLEEKLKQKQDTS